MTFEEFFKKKKINLVTFEQGDQALFSEFRIHFEQMGEKSFDHTKKYWFNKLRLRFPAPVEIKVEKVEIENKLAEQTITNTLSEQEAASIPSVGFKPRFKAGMTKPVETAPDAALKPEIVKPGESAPPPATSTSVGFKPRFKAGVTKAVAPPEQQGEPIIIEDPAADQSKENTDPKPAYKPRFNMKNVKPKE